MIYAVDSIMGSGKTQAMIGTIMRDSDPDRRWLYVTPYLDEVARIEHDCEEKHFVSPKNFGSKTMNFRALVDEGRNIATTHSLFNHLDCAIMGQLEEKGYTLVIDEVLEDVSYVQISESDEVILNNGFFVEGQQGNVLWGCDRYDGLFNEYKSLADSGRLYRGEKGNYLTIFPYMLLSKFRDVYILTYMFDAQIMRGMLELNGLGYEKLSAKKCGDGFGFVPYSAEYDNEWYKTRINILEHRKLNKIGDGYWDLSSSWYKRNTDTGALKTLSDNCYNFFHNIAGTKTDQCLWTTFKPFVNEVGHKGFKKGFLAQNARATNKYADRTAVAYTVNQFMLTPTKVFLHDHGIQVDENQYALSNMLQFIWRSHIREGGEIDVYVPSSRMRGLLKDFVDGKRIECHTRRRKGAKVSDEAVPDGDDMVND